MLDVRERMLPVPIIFLSLSLLTVRRYLHVMNHFWTSP